MTKQSEGGHVVDIEIDLNSKEGKKPEAKDPPLTHDDKLPFFPSLPTEFIRQYAKKQPYKAFLAVFLALEFICIITGIILIHQIWIKRATREPIGSGFLDLETSTLHLRSWTGHPISLTMSSPPLSANPVNCWQTRGGHDHLCFSWPGLGQLYIDRDRVEESLECHTVHWKGLKSDIENCFDTTDTSFMTSLDLSGSRADPSGSRMLTGLQFGPAPPLSGFQLGSGRRILRGTNEELVLVSDKGSFIVIVPTQMPIRISSHGTKFCISHDSKQTRYHGNRDQLFYSICSAPSSGQALRQYRAAARKDMPDLDISPIISKKVLWTVPGNFHMGSDDVNVGSGNTSEISWSDKIDMGREISVNSGSVNLAVLEGLFTAEASDESVEVVRKLNDEEFETYIHVSPYFSINHPVFVQGAENGHWLLDPTGVAPALSVFDDSLLSSVHAVINPTNERSVSFFNNYVIDYMDRFNLTGVYFDLMAIENLPRAFSSDKPIGFPYFWTNQMIGRSALALARETGSMPIVSDSATSQVLGGYTRMAAREYSWRGLREAMQAMESFAIAGTKYFASPEFGDDSTEDPELFLRWLQFSVYTPLPCINLGSITSRELAQLVEDLLTYRNDVIVPLLASAAASTAFNEPITRPLWWGAPDEDTAAAVMRVEGQFMVGEDLMVAPIYQPGVTSRRVYLPKGSNWSLWLTGVDQNRILAGGQWLTIETEQMENTAEFYRCDPCLVTR